MGIKDEFHQKAILTCIDELKNKQQSSPPAESKEENLDGNYEYEHSLSQQSFSVLEKCSKCQKYLRGLLNQGFYCKDCGLIAHRTCAATGLPGCLTPHEKMYGLTARSVFGRNLCSLFNISENPAPAIIMNCIQALETKARDDKSLELYNLYAGSQPAELNEICKSLSENGPDIDFGDYSAACIVGILKKFLRELPDYIIPVQWYEKFIEAASK